MKRLMPFAVLTAAMTAAPFAVLGPVRGDAGDIASQLATVKASLDKITGEVKTTAENALAMAAKNGGLTADLKASSDKLLTDFHGLSQKHSELTTRLEAAETKNAALEQEVAGRGARGNEAPQSLGAMVAASAQLKQHLAAGAKGSLTINVQHAITTAAGSGGGMIWPTAEKDPVRMPRRTLSVLQLVTSGRTDSNVVPYTRQTTRTNAAAPVAEMAAAPASSYGWTKAEAMVRKMAHITHISEESLADAAMLQTELDSEMRYGLDLVLETQLVAGDGTGENLTGMRPLATAFSAAVGLPDATRIDRLRLGLLQLTLANYSADGLLLHDTDWAAIELLKDTTGRYVFGNPGAGSTTPRLWNLDVATTLAQSAGEWMAGNFMMAATYYDRADVEILISSEHGTNFVDGMLTMKGTRRGALAVKRPAALVKGNFTFV
jgi:HK97 family phage major capsid protein